MTEADLLCRLKTGSNEAFAELLALYQNAVLNICYRFLLNKEDAEDISQDVFVEVYNSVSHFRGESKLSTWLYRIAVSKSLDEIKKRNRKKRFSSLGRAIGLEQIAGWFTNHERPDVKIEQDQDMLILLNALNQLPNSQRIALTLSKMEDYSNRQIAEIMESSLTAVDSLIYRGKQNLKAILYEQRQNSNEMSPKSNVIWKEENKYMKSSTTWSQLDSPGDGTMG
ncbi:MAG: RNA polymerase sigma factor [Bacteroidota bacterium]